MSPPKWHLAVTPEGPGFDKVCVISVTIMEMSWAVTVPLQWCFGLDQEVTFPVNLSPSYLLFHTKRSPSL